MSNQTWGSFEAGGALTYRMREAVRKAFGWPGTWPDDPHPTPPGEVVDELRQLIATQALQMEQLTERVADLDAEIRLLRLAVGRAAAGSS